MDTKSGRWQVETTVCHRTLPRGVCFERDQGLSMLRYGKFFERYHRPRPSCSTLISGSKTCRRPSFWSDMFPQIHKNEVEIPNGCTRHAISIWGTEGSKISGEDSGEAQGMTNLSKVSSTVLRSGAIRFASRKTSGTFSRCTCSFD